MESTLSGVEETILIEVIARKRCAAMMNAFQNGGFGAIEAGRIRVCEIELGGVTLNEDMDDLVIGKGATCSVNVELEVEPSNCNWVSRERKRKVRISEIWLGYG